MVLPPLLYSASLEVSYADLRALLRPIVQLGVGLVVVTAVVVALVAHAVVPGLSLPAALVLVRWSPRRTRCPPRRSGGSSACPGR